MASTTNNQSPIPCKILDAYPLLFHNKQPVVNRGRTHGYGKIAVMDEMGVNFVHRCVGQALPLVYLYSPGEQHSTPASMPPSLTTSRPASFTGKLEETR